MDTTLNQSQKHLNHIKSIFGGVKDWWGGKKPSAPATSSLTSSNSSAGFGKILESSPSTSFYDNSVRGESTANPTASVASSAKKFDVTLDSNLDEMSSGLSRLKLLASGLGDEINDQNQLLGNMNKKSENVEVKLRNQQRSIDQILGKKK